jgi:hypothetical protein
MGRACSTHGEEEEYLWDFGGEARHNFDDLIWGGVNA